MVILFWTSMGWTGILLSTLGFEPRLNPHGHNRLPLILFYPFRLSSYLFSKQVDYENDLDQFPVSGPTIVFIFDLRTREAPIKSKYSLNWYVISQDWLLTVSPRRSCIDDLASCTNQNCFHLWLDFLISHIFTPCTKRNIYPSSQTIVVSVVIVCLYPLLT